MSVAVRSFLTRTHRGSQLRELAATFVLKTYGGIRVQSCARHYFGATI